MVLPNYRALVDKRHPITRTLTEAFGGRLSRGRRSQKAEGEGGPSPRLEIASESLCDDTIKYLAPTLEQHKGCTIIDVHPGASLFSAKLHDYLKPKRHILMEPDERYYDTFLKPLLEKPGSVYRHTPLSGAHPNHYWTNYATMMDDSSLFSPRPKMEIGDPKLRQLDPSVLLIGNLARRYNVRRRSTSVNYDIMVLQQMAWAALDNHLIHRNGLVRMLWWMPEANAALLFPATEAMRHTTSTAIDVGVSLSEVVGTMPPWQCRGEKEDGKRKRPDVLAAFMAKRAERSMRENGMQKPESRDFLLEYKGPKLNEEVVSPLEPIYHSADELRTGIISARARLAKVKETGIGAVKGRKVLYAKEEALVKTLEFPQCVPVVDWFRNQKARLASIANAADMALRIIRLEACVKALEDKAGENEPSLSDLRKDVLAIDDDFNDWLMTGSQSRLKGWVETVVEEQIGFFSSPPLMALERRSYEPLKAEDHEFWPRNRMMLVDMVPKTRDFSVPDLATATQSIKTAQMLLRVLFESRAQTLPHGLERVAPNAGKDLIPQVPAITDPRKGGRLDAEKVRVRMLSDEMVEGLVKAWTEWPFKPSSIEMELALESMGEAGAEDEVTGDLDKATKEDEE